MRSFSGNEWDEQPVLIKRIVKGWLVIELGWYAGMILYRISH
ncbi:MAG TPA: hypothetical protein VJ824_17255 [Bacillota bacterium]|nr:hypothetical protein [Bacillota bacterium]